MEPNEQRDGPDEQLNLRGFLLQDGVVENLMDEVQQIFEGNDAVDQLMDEVQEIFFEDSDYDDDDDDDDDDIHFHWIQDQFAVRDNRREQMLASVQGAGPPFPWWSRALEHAPTRPVLVGLDKDGGPLYVGRAWHCGHLLPAKVAPTHQGAFVAWGGAEHSKFFSDFEVLHLVRGHAEWMEASDGDVPAQAFPVGQTTRGELVYVGRVSHDGTVTPGRLIGNEGACFIPYGGKEIGFKKYDVLVVR